MNNLFASLVQVLRKQRPSASNVIPFAVGRVYQCAYRNYHHDPRPCVLVLGSNAFYTVGINVHYIGTWGNSLQTQIVYFRQSNRVLTGQMVYNTIKQRTPMIPKLGFRKYFTSLLRGQLVSEGISQMPELNIRQFLADPWVKQLNRLIRPQVFNKVVYNPAQSKAFSDQIIQTQFNSNSQKPFANRSVVQYRQPVQMPGIATPEGEEGV